MGWKNAYFKMVHFMLLFNNIKIVFRAEQYQIHNLHMGVFPELLFVVSGHI